MLRLDRGSAIIRLVSAFEERGYRWAYRVVNSLSFVPQRRERVYLLASLEGDPADVLFVDDAEPERSETTLDTYAHGFYWTEGIRGLGWGRLCSYAQEWLDCGYSLPACHSFAERRDSDP